MTIEKVIKIMSFIFLKTYLDCFLELHTEILKEAEAFIQLKGVLVFAKEVNQGVPFLSQI